MKFRLYSVLIVSICIGMISVSLANSQYTVADPERGAAVQLEKAVFAGGCFWCVESDFAKQPGVLDVVSGYSGGIGKNPTYSTYAAQGYFEAVEVSFDPSQTSYGELLDVFWHHIDPTDAGGQFVDRGPAYRSVIVYLDKQQKVLAEKSKDELNALRIFAGPVVTEIVPFSSFYPAEEYHQDYAKRHPFKYKYYRYRSGRDQFLSRVWQKEKGEKVLPDESDLRRRLSPLQ